MNIISMKSLGKNGRLGNQLFQVSSLMGIAERNGARAAFPPWPYEKYFKTKIPHGEMQQIQRAETAFEYQEIVIDGDCDLHGYYQSEKYFGSTRLELDPEFVASTRAKMPDLFKRPVICIQVRRGDYVGNDYYYQVPPTFYIDALITYFPDWRDHNLLFISDDIEYCKVQFSCFPNAYFSTARRDIDDMALASC